MSFTDNVVLPKRVIQPKGRAKIEIFDAKGNKVDEQIRDNYVHPKLLEALADVSQYLPFGVGFKPALYTAYEDDIITGIALTDNTSPADPLTDRYVEGNVIGMAEVGGIGGTEVRGTYNALESVIRQDYQKYVYDFATSEANGTFQSVYMGKFSADNYTDHVSTTPTGLLSLVSTSYSAEVKVLGDKLYKWEGTLLEVFDFNDIPIMTNSTDGFNNMPKEEYTLPFTINSVTLRGNELYFLFSNGMYIYKAPVTDPTNVVEVLKIYDSARSGRTSWWGWSYSYTNGLAYDYSNDTFLIRGYENSMYNTYRVDSTTWEILEMVYEGRGLDSYAEISKINPRFLIGSAVYDLESKTISWDYNASYFYGLREINADYSMCVVGRYSKNFTIMPSPQFFSRVLLDNPVTKTSLNTMKITYEYNFPKFSLFK